MAVWESWREPMEGLRDEILQSEGVRSDLLKWKLALAGILGAAGLGFSGSEDLRHADLVLCAIPPVCVYVDLLCLHLNLKMLVIGTFLRTMPPRSAAGDIRRYEQFVDEQARQLTIARPRYLGRLELSEPARRMILGKESDRSSAFDLEDWALSLSTIALSLALIVYACFQASPFSLPFALSGVAGLVTTAIGNWQFAKRFEAVRALERT
jgi:hypothetical protein